MGRFNDQQNPPQQDPPDRTPEIQDPPSDLPDYTDPQPPHPQDPTPPVIKSKPFDPNDRFSYIREPDAEMQMMMMPHYRDVMPSEMPYRL
jgi:hypothetical protein